MIVQGDWGSSILLESQARDELQLQELMKENPDLLPIEELGMTGPLMVVGRETSLPSGAIDLAALTRGGDLLLIEFKTGPQNPDFRHSLSQLIDYGSDLWGMSLEEFESTVPQRFFASARCNDVRVRGVQRLRDAATAVWPDLTEIESETFIDRLSGQLRSGLFHYVLVAQRFSAPVEKTIEYLNSTMRGATFYAIELVRFSGNGLSAFESRTIVRPPTRPAASSAETHTNEEEFLGQLPEPYSATLRELFEAFRGQRLVFEWGVAGPSIRLPTTDRPEPLTIAWVFPPGRASWMGLTNFTLGYDQWSANQCPSARPALEAYVASAGALPGASKVTKGTREAFTLLPDHVVAFRDQVKEIAAELVRQVNEDTPQSAG